MHLVGGLAAAMVAQRCAISAVASIPSLIGAIEAIERYYTRWLSVTFHDAEFKGAN
jgi:hypothetical protein